MGAVEDIAEALRPAVAARGLEIWDVERSGNLVRVMVERPSGVDLDTLSQLSGDISALLDQRDDLVPVGHYELEVSSPGLERRLRYPRHFAPFVGQEIAVKTLEAVNGTRRLRGSLVGASDEDITLRVTLSSTPGSSGVTEDVRLPLASIERANTVFTWGESSKTPRSGRSGPRAAVEEEAR